MARVGEANYVQRRRWPTWRLDARKTQQMEHTVGSRQYPADESHKGEDAAQRIETMTKVDEDLGRS
jgi:hypothetical protein